MSVTVRNAEAADYDRCTELLRMLANTTGSSHGPNPQPAFDLLLDGSRGEIHVATEQTVILGFAAVSYNVAMRYGGEYCQLEELIVDPEARGKKVGRLLMEATLEKAKKRGCAEYGLYLLETTEGNRAFYEKYGFSAIGTEMRQSL